MRKYKAWLAALFLAGALCIPAAAESAEESNLQVVSCPEQDFATLVQDGFAYDFSPEDGLCIYTGDAEAIPFVLVFKADGAGFDADNYFNNVLTPQMYSNYGERLTYVGDYGIWNVAGIEMPGQMYRYLIDDTSVILLRLFDIRDDSFVCYTAKYLEQDPDATLGALATAAYCYQPDAEYYDGGIEIPGPEISDPGPQNTETLDMMPLSYPEMGFSFLAPSGYYFEKDESSGVTVYTETDGSIPYIMVFRSEDLVDGWEYLTEMYTPRIIDKYGEDLIEYTEYDDYTVGGKELPAGVYTYRVGDYIVDMVKIFDAVDGHTVTYTAKYLKDMEDATLEALDLAVASFQSDPDYYNDFYNESGYVSDEGYAYEEEYGYAEGGNNAEAGSMYIGSIPLPSFEPQEDTAFVDFDFSAGKDSLGPVDAEPEDEPEGTDIVPGIPEDTIPVDGTPEDTEPQGDEGTDQADTGDLQLYQNTEQDFSFLYPQGCDVRTSDYGSAILSIDPEEGIPFVLVARYTWSNDGASYLENIAANAVDSQEIVREPEGPAPVEGNPGMYAMTYSFMNYGTEMQVTCFTEEFDDGFMYFETRYYNDSDPEAISNVLSTILSTAQPAADAYGE